MTPPRMHAVAALCAAALLAAAPLAALAVDAVASRAPTSPDQPKPRVGDYKVVSRGATAIRAKCAEGGNVLVPTHAKATAAQRDRAIRDACKTTDYTK